MHEAQQSGIIHQMDSAMKTWPSLTSKNTVGNEGVASIDSNGKTTLSSTGPPVPATTYQTRFKSVIGGELYNIDSQFQTAWQNAPGDLFHLPRHARGKPGDKLPGHANNADLLGMKQEVYMKPGLLLFLTVAACMAAGPTTPNFLARRDYPFLGYSWLDVADTNGDGIPDLVVTSCGAATVSFGNGNGTFRSGPKTLTQMRGGCIGLTADLRGNGTVDLVFAGGIVGATVPYGIGVCLGDGNGTFQPVTLYQAGNDIEIGWPAVGDLNGDGILDAATIGESGLWVFLGKGDGTLAPGVLTPFANPGNALISAGDFTGDGKLDLVVTTHTGFAVFHGNGDGTFQTPPLMVTTPARPAYIAVGDLNLDGLDDLVVRGNADDVGIYWGSASGSFTGPSPETLSALNTS